MLISALIFGVMFTNCGSDKPEQNTDEPTALQFVKVELGGCNARGEFALRSDDSETKDNTVLITVSEDSVHVFVGVKYTCKGTPFNAQCELIDDVMCMYIIDTGGEYFRCLCYYTFNFIFQRKGAVNQKYKILLTDRGGNLVVISEGTITENK